jgi:hypothetical protein
MTGIARLHFGDMEWSPTGRGWAFLPDRYRWRPLPREVDWEFLDSSPFNPDVDG